MPICPTVEPRLRLGLRSPPMLVDSTRNRIVVRLCVAIVATVCPFSLAFSLFTLLFHLDFIKSLRDPRFALFVWSLSESIFWLWSVTKYNFPSPKSVKVVPSFQERQKLKEDCLWIIQSSPGGAAEFLEGWFTAGKHSARIEDLRQDNVKDWLCWAYFASPLEEVEGNPELRDEMEQTLDELFGSLRGSFPDGQIPAGRNLDVECIRLTLDPMNPEHRPLAFYFVVYLLQRSASLLFRAHGYAYYHDELPDQPPLGYWYRAPTITASDLPPLVVIHGIGSILSLIWFVTSLAIRANDRHIIVLDIGHISMRLPRPTQFPSPIRTTTQLCNILDRHIPNHSNEPTKAVFFGHSLGSALAVWLLKFAPERLSGLVLCDPISLLLQYSDVAYNFVYRPSLAAAEIFFEWIAKEPGIALTLGRNFHWFDNVFPMIAGEGDGEVRFFPQDLETVVFLSEKDCIVPTGRIYDFLTKKRVNVAVHVMPELDHGGFLFDTYWLDMVLNTLVQMDRHKVDRGDF